MTTLDGDDRGLGRRRLARRRRSSRAGRAGDVQVGMGLALLAAAVLLRDDQPRPLPGRRRARSASRSPLLVGRARRQLRARRPDDLGIGLYAPCMILVALLGMNPTGRVPDHDGLLRVPDAGRQRCASSAKGSYNLAAAARADDRRHPGRPARRVRRQVAAADGRALARLRRRRLHGHGDAALRPGRLFRAAVRKSRRGILCRGRKGVSRPTARKPSWRDESSRFREEEHAARRAVSTAACSRSDRRTKRDPRRHAAPDRLRRPPRAHEFFKASTCRSNSQDIGAAMIDSEIGHNPGLQPYRDVMLTWLQKYMTWDAMKPELTKLLHRDLHRGRAEGSWPRSTRRRPGRSR